MKDLNELRNEIDLIDEEIIKLFEKRLDIVQGVINYKIENNIPILDSSRENLMLEKNLKKIKNEKYKKYYNDILKGYLKASKDLQKDILENKK